MADLAGIAWRRGQAQMAIGRAGQHAPARRALHETLLHQIRLDDFLDGVARFAQRGGDGLDADRAAAETLRDQLQIAPVEGIEARAVHFQPRQRRIGDLRIDVARARDGRRNRARA